MHLLSLRVTIKVSGRKVTHHFHQKGTFELACEVRICRRGPRKMILVLSRVPYIHICFVVIWDGVDCGPEVHLMRVSCLSVERDLC